MTKVHTYPRLVIIAVYAFAGWSLVFAAYCALAAIVLVMGVQP
ncbi:hypothetical protein [Devosia soli]|nr:hypothetical protein [Devosia soli]